MIVAFSTSSSLASIAVFDANGELFYDAAGESHMKASALCLSLLQESGVNLADVSLFLADMGPGSFTGTRVGVTLAKTLAFSVGAECGGADAFDLISSSQTVVFPSKKGEWFVRIPGQLPVRTTELPIGDFLGFGPGIENPTYPEAKRFGPLLSGIAPTDAISFVPAYLIEPSISVQKKGLGLAGGKA